MEAWLSIPIRLLGVALLAWFIYLSFGGVTGNISSALPSAATETDPAATAPPPRDYRIPLLALGIGMAAFLIISFERKQVRRFQSVVAAIEVFGGSIQFDPPARSPSQQLGAKCVTVDLSDTKVTDELFPDVNRIPNLRVVRMANTLVGSNAIRILASCRKLDRMDISQTGLTSSDMQPFENHTKLRCFIANDTGIDDEVVPTLISCTGLVQIEIHNTRLTEAGVGRLVAALPKADIAAAVFA